ncbi:hexitol phosphatase HxpB [Orbus wheelerorum]|uniref:hexitol phosphatase HxpB n=1 Tax=Orbus wheelerorum TaxID=3074111 RepID=UPI00370DDA21
MTKLFNTQAVLFDMDGILLDSEPLWEDAVKESLALYGVDYDELHQNYQLSTTGIRINQVVDLYCKIVPQKNIPPKQMVDKIIDLVIDKILATKPILPGVNEALALCHELGLKVGLASSSPMRVIEVVTDCLGITSQFDIRVSAEKLNYGKPHPAVYLQAAAQIAVDPLNCLTIEDSLAGMVATKAARMTSIVVPASCDSHFPQWCLADHHLSSLLELNKVHLK